MLRTLNDSDLLTGQQLVFLDSLADGEWHDRKFIRGKMKLKKLIPSILSERIIKPMEEKGLVEQEEVPVREGSRKMKKLVRLRKDVYQYRRSLLVFHSTLAMLDKYRAQQRQQKKLKRGIKQDDFTIYSRMYYESARHLRTLEKIGEERQRLDEAKFWEEWSDEINSEPWHQLVELHKLVYSTLKSGCERCCEAKGCPEGDCYPLRRPGISFIIASKIADKWKPCDAKNPPVSEILQQEKYEAINRT
ncbi:MAG: hypothetical protein A4E45_01755 [Methanosaeta sp. PtaB.Bin039]|nr:MAG: hypothetical protein A4E45_01755 [Methanosaeta sp. PtaB.Bin039]